MSTERLNNLYNSKAAVITFVVIALTKLIAFIALGFAAAYGSDPAAESFLQCLGMGGFYILLYSAGMLGIYCIYGIAAFYLVLHIPVILLLSKRAKVRRSASMAFLLICIVDAVNLASLFIFNAFLYGEWFIWSGLFLLVDLYMVGFLIVYHRAAKLIALDEKYASSK